MSEPGLLISRDKSERSPEARLRRHPARRRRDPGAGSCTELKNLSLRCQGSGSVRVEAQRALLTVFDGKITARNAQGELTVTGGQSLTAEAGQAPAPYILVRPRDAVQWALYYPIILLPLADRSGAAARETAGPLSAAVELAARGEYAAAFAAFDSIPDPERGAEFYLYRAATLLSVGRVDDARADIDQALARDPSDGRAYALSALSAVAQNERDQALADGEHGVELSPRSAAARETMQQAVADEPENALAWARLSELWLMQGYRGRALKAAKKARKLAAELERAETTLASPHSPRSTSARRSRRSRGRLR